ncbi:PelD GGDEF domain-containing protein [Pollutimonas sp. M17]|uniref:PelD GGDEF domain-containing protein n=1 Tax=Pollutimonas sp. M17 TaxID=2962065 RepID=UPI0021F3E0A1|nr:PelD GGDEF domain-containing protein [Pollutimonas sp. M17]UYO93591.1 hypothetical protein OEG81_17220 [Pollutimonas sp. M17]
MSADIMSTVILPQDSGRRVAADHARRESRYLAIVAPNGLRSFAVLEVVTGMAAALGLAYILRPDDPLLIGSPYPWLWLLATIFALRYGALLGVLSGLCIVAAAWLFHDAAQYPMPTVLLAGGMIQLVVVGHCSDVWVGRLRRLNAANDYLGERLGSLITNHYLLRASHEHMEREMLGRSVTLRDAIAQLRKASRANLDGQDVPGMQQLLDYAACVSSVDHAAIYRMTDKGLSPDALASIGPNFPLDLDDPLLRACLESHQLTHLRSPDGESSTYVACVPLIANERGLIAVLVVRGMPFLALNTDNLQLLRALLNYYVDGLAHTAVVKDIQQHVPTCPEEFALELGRLARLTNEAGIPSTLMAFEFSRDALSEPVMDILRSERRTLDLIWLHATEQTSIVFVLLPLTDTVRAQGCRLRVKRQCQDRLALDLDAMDVHIDIVAVPAQAPGLALRRLLYRGHHG